MESYSSFLYSPWLELCEYDCLNSPFYFENWECVSDCVSTGQSHSHSLLKWLCLDSHNLSSQWLGLFLHSHNSIEDCDWKISSHDCYTTLSAAQTGHCKMIFSKHKSMKILAQSKYIQNPWFCGSKKVVAFNTWPCGDSQTNPHPLLS